MFIGSIRDDFDNLRGDKKLEDIGKIAGMHRQGVYMSFQREHVVAPQIVRMFEAIGYDIALTYIPKGESSEKAIANTSSLRKPQKTFYRISRGTIRLNERVPDTQPFWVSSAAMLAAVESEGNDLYDLAVVTEIENKIAANTFYQNMKKELESEEDMGHDFADVLTISRIDSDGTVTMVNKWAGSLKRPRNGKPGRKPKETQSTVNSLSDALKVLSKRE